LTTAGPYRGGAQRRLRHSQRGTRDRRGGRHHIRQGISTRTVACGRHLGRRVWVVGGHVTRRRHRRRAIRRHGRQRHAGRRRAGRRITLIQFPVRLVRADQRHGEGAVRETHRAIRWSGPGQRDRTVVPPVEERLFGGVGELWIADEHGRLLQREVTLAPLLRAGGGPPLVGHGGRPIIEGCVAANRVPAYRGHRRHIAGRPTRGE